MTCPLLYRFRAIDRLPEPPSPAAVRGTLVHAVLENLFDRPAQDRTYETARALLPSAWRAMVAEDPGIAAVVDGDEAEFLRSAEPLLVGYFQLEDPRRLDPAEREFEVTTELTGGLTLRGFIDRLDIAADGAIRVVDYKTGRVPGQGFENKALFQMRVYALLIWRTRGVVPRLLQLMYLGTPEVLRYEPDVADLLATENTLLALRDAINLAEETGDFRPKTSRLCDFCAHRAICPAWGGSPPPLPERPVAIL
jgi:putative RecB family exonuclease